MMNQYVKNLGKVRPTTEGDHNINKEYDILSIVTAGSSSYISRKFVPIGTSIDNKEYWQLLAKGGTNNNDDPDIDNEQLEQIINDISNQSIALTNHVNDNNAHTTNEEKNRWNNGIVSNEEREKWNQGVVTDEERETWNDGIITEEERQRWNQGVGGESYTADEEDITLIQNADDTGRVYQFKNRDTSNGMGYIILRKEKTLTEQVTEENTIYEVRYNFNLGGNVLNIPVNCILDFKGGSFSNGTIQGNNTIINSHPNYNIFNDCIIKNFNLSFVDIRWFGAISDFVSSENVGTDSSYAFQRALDNAIRYHIGVPIFVLGNFYIATTIRTKVDFNIRGYHSPSRKLANNENEPLAVFKSPSSIFVKDGITGFIIEGLGGEDVSEMKSTHITIDGIKLESLSKTAKFIRCTTFGAPSRPGFCQNTEASGFDKVFEFNFEKEANTYGTNYYNFTLGNNCNFFNNNESIYSIGRDVTSPSLGGLSIQNNVLEQGAKINCNNCFGFVSIKNNLLEGQDTPITLTTNIGNMEIVGNYFEQCAGTIKIHSKNVKANRLTIKDNHIYNCPDLKLSLATLNLVELDKGFIGKNVSLSDVNVLDEYLLDRLVAKSIKSYYPIKFPKFELISANDYPSQTFKQAAVKDFRPWSKNIILKDSGITINTQEHTNAWGTALGYNYIDISGNSGEYVVIAFWKSAGYVDMQCLNENQSANIGYPGVNKIASEEGFYILSFVLTNDITKLYIRFKASNEQSIYISRPTISILTEDEANTITLRNLSKLVTQQYSAPTSGSSDKRPKLTSEGYYYSNFKSTVGFTYFDTDLNKMIVFNGNKWVNLDGTDLT